MSNKVYDRLKWVCLIAMPEIIACFVTISSLINMQPELITIISGIMAALNTLLGTLLGISNINYWTKNKA